MNRSDDDGFDHPNEKGAAPTFPLSRSAAGEHEVRRDYEEIAPLLLHIANRKFGIGASEATDLVHDVFVTYLRATDRIKKNKRAYLVAAICRASRRHLSRRRGEPLPDVTDHEPVDENAQHLETLITKLTVARLLNRIGSRCREVFMRFYAERQAVAEIAAAMRTSEDNVYRILHDCRIAAREQYIEIAQVSRNGALR